MSKEGNERFDVTPTADPAVGRRLSFGGVRFDPAGEGMSAVSGRAANGLMVAGFHAVLGLLRRLQFSWARTQSPKSLRQTLSC